MSVLLYSRRIGRAQYYLDETGGKYVVVGGTVAVATVTVEVK